SCSRGGALTASPTSRRRSTVCEPLPDRGPELLMSGKPGGHAHMARRKHEGPLVLAPDQLHERLADARRYKLVETSKDIKQRAGDAVEVDRLSADRESAVHEPVPPKDLDDNFTKQPARQRPVAAHPVQEPGECR